MGISSGQVHLIQPMHSNSFNQGSLPPILHKPIKQSNTEQSQHDQITINPVMNITMNQFTVNNFNKKNLPAIKKIADIKNKAGYLSPYAMKSINK